MPTKNRKHAPKNYQLPDKFGQWMGYKIKKIDKKKFEAHVTLDLRDDHLSPAGKIHGGVVSGFFDFACGAAVFSSMNPRDFCSTVELKVNYFRPLDVGDKLTCHSKVMFRGKRLCVVHAQLFRKGAKPPVAMATATFNIVPAKK
jgi:uncharacterized protein (TIGR00369 family)